MEKKLILVGLITGLCSSLFGIGGGLILIPALVFFLRFSMHHAIAVSLAAVVPITLMGATVQLISNFLSISIIQIALIVFSAFIGSYIGVHWVHNVSNSALQKAFSIFLVILAFMTSGVLPGEPVMWPMYTMPIIGFLVGLVSAIFGLAGGTVLVPALITLYQFEPRLAVATSLISVFPIATLSAYLHHEKGALPLKTLFTVVPAALFGVIIGTVLLGELSGDIVKILFSFFLLLVAYKMWFTKKDKSP